MQTKAEMDFLVALNALAKEQNLGFNIPDGKATLDMIQWEGQGNIATLVTIHFWHQELAQGERYYDVDSTATNVTEVKAISKNTTRGG